MHVVNSKTVLCSVLLASFAICLPRADSLAGETFKELEGAIQSLILSNSKSIVTVTSRFSDEVSVDAKGTGLPFFGAPNEKQPLSYVNVGSGTVFNDAGFVVTRSSIVWGAKRNWVTFADGVEVDAQFIGHDPETGLAVLKLNLANAQPVQFGDSNEVKIGGLTIVVGNSLGVFPSVTLGVVNGLREDSMIQLSASLHPGSNGSPVLNLLGEVIGVVAGQLNPANTVSGFAVRNPATPTLAYPINRVRRIVDDLIKYGYVRTGWLGVVGYQDDQRPKIDQIKTESPAERAGLTQGDIILRFAYRQVNSISELATLVEQASPGEKVAVDYLRDGATLSTTVLLGEKQKPAAAPSAATTATTGGSDYRPARVEPHTPDLTDILIEKNAQFERRINYLEMEIIKLRKLLETY